MITERFAKNRLVKTVFGCLFAIMSLFSSVATISTVHAEEQTPSYTELREENNNTEDTGSEEKEKEETGINKIETVIDEAGCSDMLRPIGWLICPMTGKIAQATDWIYGKIAKILTIKPVEMKDEEPIYKIWKYMLGVTNIVFIIFLLVVVYSQLTGLGISNYGIKKALPKMVVVAILMNLSFLICSLAVDISNIIGSSLRGVFSSIGDSTMGTIVVSDDTYVAIAELQSAVVAGTGVAIGGAVLAFESGAIFMLIPVLLGAVVAVVSGLITISLRQAVVVLLIMIAPLAFVACMLPNTEQWFKKWKQLFIKMLVFYPMFSLLFGASNLAGWAIMSSAMTTGDGFWLLLGTAVQIFPLFFSWNMMKMSGTFLGTINAKMRGLAARPLATNRAWADSHRQATKQKFLASDKAYTPTMRLNQFLFNRSVEREEETKEFMATARNKALSVAAKRNYKKDGTPSKKGIEAYDMQARNMEYQKDIEWHKNNMNKGLGQLEAVKSSKDDKLKARLNKLDVKNVEASDALKWELSRGAKIDFENTVGYYERSKRAIYANVDQVEKNNKNHEFHRDVTEDDLKRYNSMKNVMEGDKRSVNFIAADAAHAYSAQSQIVKSKFSEHFANLEATQDINNELKYMTEQLKNATKNQSTDIFIDPIIAGLRTINMRGDTDIVYRRLNDLLKTGKVNIGSHAMQAIANYAMFDVKGSDPTLRRFGKYINLQTAKMFNEAPEGERRTRRDISFREFINGEYVDREADGKLKRDKNGRTIVVKTSKSARQLLEGTSFKEMERTGVNTLNEMIADASTDIVIDENGEEKEVFNYETFKKNQKDIWEDSIMANVIGDHFSFLSGSEQIKAMSQGVTGISPKDNTFDWGAIFGKNNKVTNEQKKDYIDNVLHPRTKKFLKSQVPSQIARSKSDMLKAIETQYALMDALEHGEESIENIDKKKMNNDELKEFVDKHFGAVSKEFINSFSEPALKGFVKMHHKGYQGEAKDKLIRLLNPDSLYNKYFSGKEDKKAKDKDDEDGMPVDSGGNMDDLDGEVVYNGTRSQIESIFSNYKGPRLSDVDGFWNEVKDAIRNSASSGIALNADTIIEQIDNSKEMYTDVAALYADIMNSLFGGFSE